MELSRALPIGPIRLRLSLSLNRWALPMCLSATIESAQSESLCIDVNVLLAHQAGENEAAELNLIEPP